NWDSRHLRVVDSLPGLWHNVVVGRDHNDGHIGDLCSPGTHGGKRLVTGGIKECYLMSAFCNYVISADVLRNPSRFFRGDLGVSYVIQQRSLSMINVPHDSDNRRPGDKVFAFFLFLDIELFFSAVN